MRVQILLIALLAWGPVGSALCEAACAQSSASAYGATEELPNAPLTGASHCHGGGGSAPASMPQESDGSDAVCVCADFDRAAAVMLPTRAQGPAVFAALAPLETRSPRTAPRAILPVDAPGHLTSPYLVQNPPLLI
jgi:hypothetical protein